MENLKALYEKSLPYLEEIRKRLYRTVLFFSVCFAIGFFATATILRHTLHFFEVKDVVIATTSPFQFTDLSIDIGFLSAMILTSPVLIYQAFMFLRPALSKREKGWFFMLVPLTLALFLLGFAYGFAVMYYALIILANINMSIGIQNIWDIGMFLSQIVLTSTLLGLLFQFPIVVTFIIRFGFMDVGFLKDKRRLAVVIIFIFVSLLPPTDGLSLIAMALPLVLLYEVTIFINSVFGRKVLRQIQAV